MYKKLYHYKSSLAVVSLINQQNIGGKPLATELNKSDIVIQLPINEAYARISIVARTHFQ